MQARPDIEGIKNRADEVPPDVHFKALSALGCERSSLPARAMCKHNCCGGENCITWLETQFRNLQTIAREATPALCAYAFELEKEIERLREAQSRAIKILQTIDWVGSGARGLIEDAIEALAMTRIKKGE